ncbi:MAG: FAD-linked oxidase C-terminal domain-containing protein [Desulfobacterium sp.]|jgi:glycolate oxidase|nr:FAD-linked oxidase C-terminal domain-containing protein [Desulfobacterium sp.]
MIKLPGKLPGKGSNKVQGRAQPPAQAKFRRDLTALLGKENCLFSPEDLLTYSYDASNERALPDAVVFPMDAGQVSAVMFYANEHGIPVVPRGAGSGLTGGSVAVNGGIVLVLERMNKIVELDTENLCAVVETGVITAHLQAVAAREGLFYPPDPASKDFSTIGGNIAENAGGMRAAKYGVTKQYVLGLEVVLPNGEIINLGSKCIKDVAGYSMTELFVGSEGTFGIITRAIIKLITLPEIVKTLAICFATIGDAGRVVPLVLKSGVVPCTLEFIDSTCLQAVLNMDSVHGIDHQIPQETKAMLLIEVDGPAHVVDRDAQTVLDICRQSRMLSSRMAETELEREGLWRVRRSIHGAITGLCPKWLEEDISVPPASIPLMLERLQELARRENLRILSFGHYADGNIHLSVSEQDTPLSPERAGVVKALIFSETVKLGGRIAAEHGIGSVKKEYLGLNLDDATLNFAMRLKKMVDPRGILNPGKVFPDRVWSEAFGADHKSVDIDK